MKKPAKSKSQMFGGKSAEQFHAEAMGNKCACGLLATATIHSFADAKDYVRAFPYLVPQMTPFTHPIVKLRGPGGRAVMFVRLGTAHACSICLPAAERAASAGERELEKRGVACFVDIRRGPGPDVPVVQVGGA